MAFAVSTIFNAKDRISKSFTRMSKNADKFGNRADKAFRRANRASSRFQSNMTGSILKVGGLLGGIGVLTMGVRAVTTEFISFDQAITSASAKFKDLDLATSQGQATLLKLKQTARDVGAATQFSAGQAAEGLDFLAMAGFNAEQSMVALPGVVNLATVANLDLARSTDIASDSLGAFGLMTTDTAQLQINFTRLNDVMALTMARTNTNMEMMFEAVQKGAPTFTAAGQTLETFNALLGIMAGSGVKGSEAGTALRNVMLRLSKPVPQAQKALKALNVTTSDSAGNFRDVVDILADMEKGLQGMGSAQRTAALSTIFGVRAVTSVNILLKEGTKSIRGFREELLDSAGASEKMANIMRQSIGNQLKALSSAAIEFGFKFFTAFETDGVTAVQNLTEAIRNFNPQPMIDSMKLIIKNVKLLAKEAGLLLKIFEGFQFFANITSQPLRLAGKIAGDLLGESQGKSLSEFATRNVQREQIPPNRAEAQSRQLIGFEGLLKIAGAPEGSTFEQKTTGAPDIEFSLLGPSGAF